MPVTMPIAFDASAVKSRSFRRTVETTLEGLSLSRTEGVWDALLSGRGGYPGGPTVVVGDLGTLTSSSIWRDWGGGPSSLFVVLLVRTALDESRLSSPDIALRVNEERFFLLDLKCHARTESRVADVMRDYFRAFVARIEPDRVLTARFSALDDILWLEFGDGLDRAVEWSKLPFAQELGLKPVAASAKEHGRSVMLRDAAGREVDVDAGSLRAAVDTGYRERLEAEDDAEREAVGSRIRSLRESLGLTQEAVSRRGGIPQESLSRIENGRRDPRLDTLRRLAKGLDLTLSQLLERLSADR